MVLLWQNPFIFESVAGPHQLCTSTVCPRRWHCGKGRSSGALLKENRHSQRTLLYDVALFFYFSNALLPSHCCFRMWGVASSCLLWKGGKKRPLLAQRSAVATLALFVCKTVLISARFLSNGFC